MSIESDGPLTRFENSLIEENRSLKAEAASLRERVRVLEQQLEEIEEAYQDALSPRR